MVVYRYALIYEVLVVGSVGAVLASEDLVTVVVELEVLVVIRISCYLFWTGWSIWMRVISTRCAQ